MLPIIDQEPTPGIANSGIESTTTAGNGPPTAASIPSNLLQVSEPLAETQAVKDESNYPTGTRFYFIVVSVSLVLILGETDSSIVAVAVPTITDHFHTVRDVG